jgi:hypothetical protein
LEQLLVLCTPAGLGSLLGRRAFARMDPARFGRAVLMALVAAPLAAVAAAAA